ATGSVECWGRNSNGGLGDGTTTQRLTPVAVTGLGGSAVAIGLGTSHSCALLATGSIECWGNNNRAQLGEGTTTNRLTPVAVTGLGGSVVSMAVGFCHACAVLAAGSVECWGYNHQGQLGDGTTINRNTPVDP
ncbi:regulator of chromosome condensation 1/beta-lactamase-inhibitor protein II, partial [Baffinella frigidus]